MAMAGPSSERAQHVKDQPDQPDWIGRPPRDRADPAPARPSWLPATPHSIHSESGDSETDPEPVSISPDVILAAYTWRLEGVCFRCRDDRRLVTRVAVIRGVELVMCGSCVLREEEQRMRRAGDTDMPYAPGRIGRSPD